MISGRFSYGLGQLDPYQQWLAAHPECIDANGNVICATPSSVLNSAQSYWSSAPAYQPAAVVPAATLATAQSPQFATMPFGISSTTTETLDSFMAQWAARAITSPGSLQGQDPVNTAISVAQSYCANENPPDCNQWTGIAYKYGFQVVQALQAQAAKVAAAASASAAAAAAAPPPVPASQPVQTTSVVPIRGKAPVAQPSPQPPPAPAPLARAPAPVVVNPLPPPPGNPPPPAPPPVAKPPVIVNPSPPSQPTTTGTSYTSPGSVLSQANGTTVALAPATSTDIIPGLPNEVLFLGGAAAALVLMFTMGGK